MEQTKHTPLPWVKTDYEGIGVETEFGIDEIIPKIHGYENREFVFTACNNHYSLTSQVQSLKQCLAIAENILVQVYENDFEQFPLPIRFDPQEEQRELYKRHKQIEEYVQSLLTPPLKK